MIPTTPRFPTHWQIGEPQLLFHPDRQQDTHRHPLRGLLEYGPFSRSLVNCVMDPIRLAILAPSEDYGKVKGLLQELDRRHQPRERLQYLPEFPGFSRVFGVRIVEADTFRFTIEQEFENKLSNADAPHFLIAEQLSRTLNMLNGVRSEFDVVLLYLPKRWENYFASEADDFDLHDHIKAVSALFGLPVQIVLEGSALSYFCRCSVMWRLSLALYCKAGGIPWKLAGTPADMAFIGLSYAVRTAVNRDRRFVTCCSQVFDADGAGLEFILYETDDVRIERDNPFLSRAEMRRLMARSLALYQRRHAGRAPNQVVVHKSTEFKKEEIEGCFDAWQVAEGLDLLQIQQDTIWRGVKYEPFRSGTRATGVAAPYPCDRGTCLQIGSREALLWTQGNAPSAVGGKNYFKEGKGIPSPILIRRFAGHGTWEEQGCHIMGLTKMNWNNDGLYDRLPVTIGYASVLARTIKRMSDLPPRPYQLRFFM